MKSIFYEPLNKGHKFRFFINYLNWHIFYKFLGRTYVVKLQNGLKSLVKPYPDHGPGEVNIWTKNVDYYQLVFVEKHLTSDSYIYDLGCNVGNRTLALAHLIKGACLIDAGFAAYTRTKEHIELNKLDTKVFQVYNYAVGKENGEVLFSNLGGASTINKVVEEKTENTLSVEMVTVEEVYKRTGITPDFIKIDVEGQDLNVLNGAINLLKEGKVKLIMAEACDDKMLDDIIEFFKNIDWKPFIVSDSGEITDNLSITSRGYNIFGCPLNYYKQYIG